MLRNAVTRLLAVAMLGLPAMADGVVINEIMYHPVSDSDQQEYIELHNSGDEVVELAGWCLDGVMLCFPPTTTLDANGFLVLASDAAAFELVYGFAPDFEFLLRLDDDGERLALQTDLGVTVFDFTYNDVWHPASDGNGDTLEPGTQPTVCGFAQIDLSKNPLSNQFGGVRQHSPGTAR